MDVLPDNSKYRDVVESYLQNRLPQETIHESFQHLDVRQSVSGISKEKSQASRLSVPGKEARPVIDTNDDHVSMPELYEDSEVETQHFIQATISWERAAKAANPKYKASIDWRHSHTWEEVLAEIEQAAQTSTDTSTVWGKIRKVFRSIGNNHKVFPGLLALLPSQSVYCSVICGGLKLVFGAASRLRTLREDVCAALLEIPFCLARTGTILKTFNGSVELHQCCSALYVSILATLGHILTYYKGNSTKRVVKATLRQDEYESRLSDSVKQMDIQSKRFQDVAQQCAYQTQVSTLAEVKVVMQHIERSRSETTLQNSYTADMIQSGTESNRENFQDLQSEVVQLRDDQAKLCALLESRSKRHAADTKALASELRKVLKDFARSNSRIDPRTNDIRRPLDVEQSYNASVAALTKERLYATEEALAILDYNNEVFADDIQENLKFIWTLPVSAQDRAVMLMESPSFHDWFASTASGALLVNGNYDASARQSPISYVCSKLLDTVSPIDPRTSRQYPSILVLAHFCGQNTESEGPATGPTVMMRNLLAQLLLGFRAFSVPKLRRLLEVDTLDVRALCDSFSDLIIGLPRHFLVICIVDGISLFEDSVRQYEEALEALQSLLEIVEACKTRGCIFKFLTTSPGASRDFCREFDDDEVIWLPAKIHPHGGLTPQKWAASAGAQAGKWQGES